MSLSDGFTDVVAAFDFFSSNNMTCSVILSRDKTFFGKILLVIKKQTNK